MLHRSGRSFWRLSFRPVSGLLGKAFNEHTPLDLFILKNLSQHHIDHQGLSTQLSPHELRITHLYIRSDLTMAQNVLLQTSMGDVVVELYNTHAPKTCQNFTTLAQKGYYNGTIFHRIIPDFMIQGGDPTGTGRGGESIFGEKFEDEIRKDLKHTGAGVLSMANSGPNTNGSQFFITLAPTPWLDGKHTIFGRVKSGMRIVQRMGLVKTGVEDRPVEEVKIVGAKLLQGDDD